MTLERLIRDSRREGREEGREEGRAEGLAEKKIISVCRKLTKGMLPETIAEALDEDITDVRRICGLAVKYAPEYEIGKILQEYLAKA